MIKLETIELFQSIIAYTMMYLPTAAIVGYMEAWLAARFGDSTSKENGFLSLNPFIHMDLLFILPILIGFPFLITNRVPVDINNVKEPHKTSKILLLFFSRAIGHIIILLISLLIFIPINKIFNNPYSSVFLLLFNALIGLNMISAIIYFVMALVRSFIHFFIPNFEDQSGTMQFLIILLPLIFMIAFGRYIEYLIKFLMMLTIYISNYLL